MTSSYKHPDWVEGLHPENESGYKPKDFNVLVRVDPVEEKTAGGVFLTTTAQDQKQYKHAYGRVIDVAKNAYFDANDDIVRVGDKITFLSYGGMAVNSLDLGNKTLYRIMADKEIKAVLKENNND